jgi:hypothetical protein
VVFPIEARARSLTSVKTPDLTMKEVAEKFGSGRYRALERLWLQEGYNAIGGIQSSAIKGAVSAPNAV